jgi:erythromycin esterase
MTLGRAPCYVLRAMTIDDWTSLARQMLTYHAGMATASDDRTPRLLGLRDAMMADNLAYIAARERPRGKVLAFAHNTHLQRGVAHWHWGAQSLIWSPAGAHLAAMLGDKYANIAVGVAEMPGIPSPEPHTLEAKLTGRMIRTARARDLPITVRTNNDPRYFPFTPDSVTNFDWLMVLASAN